MNAPVLSPEHVRLAYRLFFGREPESQAAVDEKLRNFATLDALRACFLESEEFRAIIGEPLRSAMHEIAEGYFAEPGRIEHQVDNATAARLAARTRDQWTRLGEADPYWSVLTHDRFRSTRIDDAAIAEFRKTGRNSARLIDLTAARTGRVPPTGTCIELGCGVGRITRYLAPRFEKVIAVDISPGNLALCERYMADEGITNVETVLIRDLADFDDLPAFDYFYSMIVLQHNSPPVQRRILETLLGKMRPGGQCLFQTLADHPGYAFDAAQYLESPEPELEMHALPMAAITAIMREKNVVLDLARLDPWTGSYGSYTFAGHREG